ncbi:MAG TPA: GAF domain-containing sensor histidine kinase [Oscillatoriaceae cyanobacterium]
MKTRTTARDRFAREPVVYKPLIAMEPLPVEVNLISALQEINERICSTTDLDELLQGICDEMGRILRADRVHLALKDPRRKAFGTIGYEYVSGGDVPATRGAELPSEHEDEVMMDLVATPPPLAVVDPLGNPKLPAGPRMVFEAMRVKSAMAGRLQYQGKVLGVLCVHQCSEVRQWSQQEATFLSVVLSQLSIAVANARMIRSMEAQHQELVSLHFKLEESHALLERQVTERTAQLREANTELVGMVEELKQLDQMKSAFLDTISHELRTPINFITGFGSLLADGAYGDLSDQAQGAVSKILTGAERLIHLVDDLLDQSKMERGQLRISPEAIDYVALVERLRAEFLPLIESKHQQLDVQLPEALPLVYADPERLHQVLRNLLSNANKFTPEGGRIGLRVTLSDGQFCTEITDTGIGIPKQAQQRIFDRFYQVDNTRTRNFGGTGLGLAIVKGLVEAMHGQILVDSDVGQGARFRVCLPLVPVSSGR